MITNGDWVETNIWGVAEYGADFHCTWVPYRFKEMQFTEAAEYTATLIEKRFGSDGLYIGLSGGADSEFVVRLFKRLEIPFTAIVIHSEVNNADFLDAMEICSELGIVPVIIKTNERKIIEYFFDKFFFKRNDGMTHVHQMLVADKARELGGWAILGEGLLGDVNHRRQRIRAYNFIPDLYHTRTIPFFYYTLELTYAEVKLIDPYIPMTFQETAAEFKARVRGTRLRPKNMPKYQDNQVYHEAIKLLKPEWLLHDKGTMQEFVTEMEPYIEL